MLSAIDKTRIEDLLLKTFLHGQLPELETKLSALTTIPPSLMPKNIVTMNTKVSIFDYEAGENIDISLVYQLQILRGHQASVLSPLGTALLGGREEQEISFIQRNGAVKKIRINNISYQPEANGDDL